MKSLLRGGNNFNRGGHEDHLKICILLEHKGDVKFERRAKKFTRILNEKYSKRNSEYIYYIFTIRKKLEISFFDAFGWHICLECQQKLMDAMTVAHTCILPCLWPKKPSLCKCRSLQKVLENFDSWTSSTTVRCTYKKERRNATKFIDIHTFVHIVWYIYVRKKLSE